MRAAAIPPTRRWKFLLAAGLLLTVGPSSGQTPPSASDPRDPWFALDRVLDVSIEMAPGDWDRLRGQTRTLFDLLAGADCLDDPADEIFTWFEAAVTVDGETHTRAGVRKKGFLGSLSEEKPALKVRFDRFVDGQLLGGAVKRLTLNNARQDPSMLNTCMAYRVFASAGLPAPRCNFATVSVNGENLGLFANVESIKTAFLERSFSDPGGNLYEGTLSDFRPDWRGTFEKKTNEEEADWSDIDAVVAALQDPSAAGLEALAAAVDLDRFLTFWAVEVLIGHWDGYAGNRNNYFVYREPGGPFQFIPWGADQVFTTTDVPFDDFRSPASVLAHGAISHRLYREEATRADYVARLKQLLDTAWNEEELLGLADEMEAIVSQHALPDVRAAAAEDAERVRRFIRGRRAAVLADLDPEPPAWPWPLTEPFCWPEKGAFELRFETAWGSSESENPLEEGEVSFIHYQLQGKQQSFLGSGAVAGFAEEDGRIEKDRASVTIVSLGKDFSIDILTVSLPIERMAGGASLPIDLESVSGFRVVLPSAEAPPNQFDLIVTGRIELEEAGTELGDRVSGLFHGTFVSFDGETYTEPGAGETGAGIGLIVNEVAAQGEPLDWFELYNDSDEPMDLADFLMADDLTDLGKRTPFPEGTVIEAGAYLQVELDKDGWPGFALGRGEELGIWTAGGLLVAEVDWESGDADEGTSWARIPDVTGEFQTVDTPTPGAPNRISSAVLDDAAATPGAFRLRGNWPNPFNASTTIAFELPETLPVRLVVHDLLGRPIRVLHGGEALAAGHHRSPWNGLDEEGRQAASGVYLYRLTAGEDFTAAGRMALIR